MGADQIINDLFFPMEIETKPAEYNTNMANNLDQIQQLMDADMLTQSNFNLAVNNDQQLADMNDWLARLSNSITDQQANQAATYAHMSNFNPPTEENYTQYPIVPSQSKLYHPPGRENEMYVRSHPMQPTVVPSQHIGEFESSYLGLLPNSQPYLDGQVPFQMGLVGQRTQYTTIPDVSNHQFQPELRTAINFTKANGLDDAEIEKREKTDSFKPTKSASYSEKKNMATLINSFSSAHVDQKKSLATRVDDSNSQKKKNVCIDDSIRDLITSDFSKLSIHEDTEKQLAADNEASHNTSLYPVATPKELSASQKHLLLIKKLTEWMNENYHSKRSICSNINC